MTPPPSLFYPTRNMEKTLDFFKAKLQEKGLDDKKHLEYLKEEFEQFEMMSAWGQIEDAYANGNKTINPNNLIIPFLLGLSEADPLQRRSILPKRGGQEDEARIIVFDDESEAPVHYRAHIKIDDDTIKHIDDLRPGDVIDGKKVFGVYSTRKTFVEVQTQKVKKTIHGIRVVPMKGKHIWNHTNEFPDIDVDFHPDDLEKIVDWCKERFGENRVVPVCNYQRFKLRSSLRDISRVHDIPLHEVNKVADTLDDDVDKMDFDDAFEKLDALKDFKEKYPKVVEAMKRLQGRVRTFGTHASALIISSVDLPGRIPFIFRKGRRLSSWVEGQDRSDLSVFGFQKFDRLGLQTLANIQMCLELLYERGVLDRQTGIFRKQGQGFNRDWEDESYLNNERSLQLAAAGETLGCFQFESHGIRKLLRDMQVDDFVEMVIANAMFRPGVLKAVLEDGEGKRVEGGHTLYCDVKFGRRKYEYPELLKKDLGETRGLMVFQEQVMKVLNLVGRIPLTDCEFVRKAISKKKLSIVNRYRGQFVASAKETVGWNAHEAEAFFDKNITSWSGYGFNKSHSLAYALIAMRTLYLKAHYPLEFFCAFLSGLKVNSKDYYEKLRDHIDDAFRFGIDILGVDINESKSKFAIGRDPKNLQKEILRIGFSVLKKISHERGLEIVANQPYRDFDDFLHRGSNRKDVVKALIAAGAFDTMCSNRKALDQYYDDWAKVKDKQGVGIDDYTNLFLKKIDKPNRKGKNRSIPRDDPDRMEFKEELAKYKSKKKMPIDEFEAYVHDKWAGELSSFEIEEYLQAIIDKIPTPVFNADMPDDSDPVKLRLAWQYYGIVMPFLHPIRLYCKEKKVHKISEVLSADPIPNMKDRQVRFGVIDVYVLGPPVEGKTKTGKSFWKIHVDDGFNTIYIRAWEDSWKQFNMYNESTNARESHREGDSTDTELLKDARFHRRVRRFEGIRDKHVERELKRLKELAALNHQEFDEDSMRKNIANQYTISVHDGEQEAEPKRKRLYALIHRPEQVLKKYNCVRMYVEHTEYGFNIAGIMNPVVPLRMDRKWTGQQEILENGKSD